MNNLVEKFQEYSRWRSGVTQALQRYSKGLADAQLDDSDSSQRVAWALERLAEDKMSIAFVAEFARGKSELINAIFFAEYGKRILPSAAGRTTMCPTELLYDERYAPCIRLLPIETRAEPHSTSDYKENPEAWTVLPLDVASLDKMQDAFREVSQTKRVSSEDAQRYGLYDPSDPDNELSVDADGMVEISRWRHAIINFPHPLLKQGLVIIDTPGLNAIGTEPELTLNLIPHAHAVLFILAADAGVTRSDIEIWREHIGTGAGRMVVLNKIDSMWDELRTPAEVDDLILGQIASVASTLNVPPAMVFPVSAQKGLVAKFGKDDALLAKSRLPALEKALSEQLIPAKREIMYELLAPDIEKMTEAKRALLATRLRNVVEQMVELKSLRGKNRAMVAHMVKRITLEKNEFDRSLLALQGTRAVFARLSAEVFTNLGMDVLKQEIVAVRQAMEESNFSASMNEAVKEFFSRIRRNIDLSGEKTEELVKMMAAMYRKFSTEHGFTLPEPLAFSIAKYSKNILLIEQVYQMQFGAIAMIRMSKKVMMQKFFDTIEAGVKKIFVMANRDVETWMKSIMSPLESQIREHKEQLKSRRQSLERISGAAGELEEKINALDQIRSELEGTQNMLAALEGELQNSLAHGLAELKTAA